MRKGPVTRYERAHLGVGRDRRERGRRKTKTIELWLFVYDLKYLCDAIADG